MILSARDKRDEIAAIKDEAVQAEADKNGGEVTDTLDPETQTVEQTYDGWLTANEISIDDQKDKLFDWDVREKDDPLGKLVEMLREETEEEAEDLQEM
eukprot:COSAG06_NODE_14151_length_1184_cov_1.220276_1_plen_97_part_10